MNIPKRYNRTTVVLRKDVLPKLREQSRRLGYRGYSDFLLFALDLVNRSEGVLPQITPAHVLEMEKPIILSGEPEAGKTVYLRDLLGNNTRPTLVVDVADEYGSANLQRINLGEFFSINWQDSGRYRFVPNSNLQVSRSEVHSIVSHLNLVKTSGNLKEWIIVLEEAHRFSEDPEVRALIAEGRKFCKVVVITSDYRLYRGLGECVMPPPWNGGIHQ